MKPDQKADASTAPPEHASDHRARIRGSLLGGALGDALGWPVEFEPLSSIRAHYGPDGIRSLDPGARGGLGAITDDTQMTLFTAEGVLRSTVRYTERNAWGPVDATDWRRPHVPHPGIMWAAYQHWLETQRLRAPRKEALRDSAEHSLGWLIRVPELYAMRSPGNTCMGALESGIPGSPQEPINHSKGCGGVMRVAPIGLVRCDDPFGYAVMAAALTHGHPSGYLSAGAYAQMLHEMLFHDAPLDVALDRAMARLARERGHEETTRALERARSLAARVPEPAPEDVQTLGGGWVGEEALAIGVYCVMVAHGNFTRGVRIAVNHSGDSDSSGSIAGGLLGVQCGERGLPAEWLAQLELRDVITIVADDLATGYGGDESWRTRYPGHAD